MTQLTEGEPLSSTYLAWDASMTLPFGLCNAVAAFVLHIAQRMCPPPVDNKFVGMADYLVEPIHDLLASDSESISDSSSSRGSYHPSRECFMADVADNALREETPDGAIQSVGDGNETPPQPGG
jgi:hypothetical protein